MTRARPTPHCHGPCTLCIRTAHTSPRGARDRTRTSFIEDAIRSPPRGGSAQLSSLRPVRTISEAWRLPPCLSNVSRPCPRRALPNARHLSRELFPRVPVDATPRAPHASCLAPTPASAATLRPSHPNSHARSYCSLHLSSVVLARAPKRHSRLAPTRTSALEKEASTARRSLRRSLRGWSKALAPRTARPNLRPCPIRRAT